MDIARIIAKKVVDSSQFQKCCGQKTSESRGNCKELADKEEASP
jgi:hypothetical protein